jgi:hypothetical protein
MQLNLIYIYRERERICSLCQNITPDLGGKWEIGMAGRVAGSFRPPSAAGPVAVTVVRICLLAHRPQMARSCFFEAKQKISHEGL